MTRERLPDRRAHEVVEFNHAGFRYLAGIGRFADGRIAEVFLTGPKIGTALAAAAQDASIVVSLALQHGAPPDTLRHALTRNADGSPASAIGAALDLLAADANREADN